MDTRADGSSNDRFAAYDQRLERVERLLDALVAALEQVVRDQRS